MNAGGQFQSSGANTGGNGVSCGGERAKNLNKDFLVLSAGASVLGSLMQALIPNRSTKASMMVRVASPVVGNCVHIVARYILPGDISRHFGGGIAAGSFFVGTGICYVFCQVLGVFCPFPFSVRNFVLMTNALFILMGMVYPVPSTVGACAKQQEAEAEAEKARLQAELEGKTAELEQQRTEAVAEKAQLQAELEGKTAELEQQKAAVAKAQQQIENCDDLVRPAFEKLLRQHQEYVESKGKWQRLSKTEKQKWILEAYVCRLSPKLNLLDGEGLDWSELFRAFLKPSSASSGGGGGKLKSNQRDWVSKVLEYSPRGTVQWGLHGRTLFNLAIRSKSPTFLYEILKRHMDNEFLNWMSDWLPQQAWGSIPAGDGPVEAEQVSAESVSGEMAERVVPEGIVKHVMGPCVDWFEDPAQLCGEYQRLDMVKARDSIKLLCASCRRPLPAVFIDAEKEAMPAFKRRVGAGIASLLEKYRTHENILERRAKSLEEIARFLEENDLQQQVSEAQKKAQKALEKSEGQRAHEALEERDDFFSVSEECLKLKNEQAALRSTIQGHSAVLDEKQVLNACEERVSDIDSSTPWYLKNSLVYHEVIAPQEEWLAEQEKQQKECFVAGGKIEEGVKQIVDRLSKGLDRLYYLSGKGSIDKRSLLKELRRKISAYKEDEKAIEDERKAATT